MSTGETSQNDFSQVNGEAGGQDLVTRISDARAWLSNNQPKAALGLTAAIGILTLGSLWAIDHMKNSNHCRSVSAPTALKQLIGDIAPNAYGYESREEVYDRCMD